MGRDKHIGETIRRLREARGWSQVQLADLSGVAGPTVNRIENGMRVARSDTLKKIADALGVSLDALVSDSSEDMTNARLEDLSFKERQVIAAWRRGDRIEAARLILNG